MAERYGSRSSLAGIELLCLELEDRGGFEECNAQQQYKK